MIKLKKKLKEKKEHQITILMNNDLWGEEQLI